MSRSFAIIGFVVASIAGCRSTPTGPELVAVEFHSEPPGAEVWVDSALAGQAPVTKRYAWNEKKPEKKVVFRMDGYYPETRVLTVNTAVIAVQMREALEMLAVTIDSDPPGALVEVNGSPAGTTPIDVRLERSAKQSHTVRLIKAGYRSEEAVVSADERGKPVKVQLKPLIPRLP
jgi:hypothetical protein